MLFFSHKLNHHLHSLSSRCLPFLWQLYWQALSRFILSLSHFQSPHCAGVTEAFVENYHVDFDASSAFIHVKWETVCSIYHYVAERKISTNNKVGARKAKNGCWNDVNDPKAINWTDSTEFILKSLREIDIYEKWTKWKRRKYRRRGNKVNVSEKWAHFGMHSLCLCFGNDVNESQRVNKNKRKEKIRKKGIYFSFSAWKHCIHFVSFSIFFFYSAKLTIFITGIRTSVCYHRYQLSSFLQCW